MKTDRLKDLQQKASNNQDDPSGGGSSWSAWRPRWPWSAPPDQQIDAAYFKDLRDDQEALVVKIGSLKKTLQSLKETKAWERQATLPEKIRSLTTKCESEEKECMRLIKLIKELVEELRETVLYWEDAAARKRREEKEGMSERDTTWLRIRANFANFYLEDFNAVVRDFFHIRNLLRQEVVVHLRRRLSFAYPEASHEILEEVLLYPQLAQMAIERRLESGDEQEPPVLEDVFDELATTKFSKDIKLTEETRELKLLFIQFSALVAQQGETLNAIEANIAATLEHTQAAMGELEGAVDAKKEAQRLMALRKFILRLLLIGSIVAGLWMIGAPVDYILLGIWHLLVKIWSAISMVFASGKESKGSLVEQGRRASASSVAAAYGALLEQGQTVEQDLAHRRNALASAARSARARKAGAHRTSAAVSLSARAGLLGAVTPERARHHRASRATSQRDLRAD